MRAAVRSPARWIALGLALAGACAFAVSVWVGTWWTVAEATIGPFGSHACFEGDCKLRGLSWTGGSDLWMRSAIATGVAGVISMFVLTWVAGGAAAKNIPRLAARTSLVAISTGLACAAYFVVKLPSLGQPPQIGIGAALYGVGAVLGFAAAFIVLRHPQPITD